MLSCILMECMVHVCPWALRPVSASCAILEAVGRWRVKAVCEHHRKQIRRRYSKGRTTGGIWVARFLATFIFFVSFQCLPNTSIVGMSCIYNHIFLKCSERDLVWRDRNLYEMNLKQGRGEEGQGRGERGREGRDEEGRAGKDFSWKYLGC